MTGELISVVVGLLTGFGTGFFFERRATRSARRDNEQLRRDLQALRDTVVSLGGNLDQVVPTKPVSDLLEAVRGRVLATQDASGRVRRQEVIAHTVMSVGEPPWHPKGESRGATSRS